jgi:hypothetical protein
VSGQLHDPAALTLGKSPLYPLDRSLGGPQSRSRCCVEKKNLALQGIEPGSSSPYTELSLPTCSTHGDHKYINNNVKKPFGRLSRRKKDNTNIDLKGIGYPRAHKRALVNAVIKLWPP